MKYSFFSIVLLAMLSAITSSCNATKYVPEDERLLTRNTVYVDGKKNVNNEITDYIVQRPNQLVLGIPLPLHFYNVGNKNYINDFEQWAEENPNRYKFSKDVLSEKQTRGLRNFKYNMHNWWLNNGEPPVIFDPKKAQQTIENIRQHYFNEGYFNAGVSVRLHEEKKNKVSIDYQVNRGSPYIFNNLNTYIDSPVLDSIYGVNRMNSSIQKGEQYDLESLLSEQDRITELFRNSGVYRFNKDMVFMEADSTDQKVDIDLFINDSISGYPFKIQHIDKIRIYTDYSYNTKDDPLRDIIQYEGYDFLAHDQIKYNPKLLLNSVFIEPGELYKDYDRELTRKHLRGLKNFRSVEIRYEETASDSLIASIYLTPQKKYSIGFNTELTHSNIRQLGISGKLSFLNRNILKGAEILKFSVQGSFLDSKDAANNDRLLNAWELGADVSLELPRMVTPFITGELIRKEMDPKTIFTLGTSLQKNIGLDKQKFTGLIDYTWETSSTLNHSLEILNTQFIKNLNVDSYFNVYKSEFSALKSIQETHFPNADLNEDNTLEFIDTYIDDALNLTHPADYLTAKNIASRHNILTEDVLIPSAAYTFTINNSENYKDTDFSFFRTRLVTSGVLATSLSNEKDENNVTTLFKTPIAQFVRTDVEYKKFWSFSGERVLAYRGFLGLAVPYGNSSTIPFSRSYFIGGPNDLRAWKIYELGPGAIRNGLDYNVGSMKFITSLEYRFKILNSIKGAMFLDAGNIWDITNSTLTDPKSKFNGLKSISDIAVGSGFGIRYDLSFILLRLDVGFKTYEPYLKEGDRWFGHMNFNHSVYNFGISYPF